MSKTESEKYNPNISYLRTELSQTFRLDTDLKKIKESFRKCKVVLERLSEKQLKSYLYPLEAPKETSVLFQNVSENPMKRKRMNFNLSEMYEKYSKVSYESSIFNQKRYFPQEREKSTHFDDKICKNCGNVSKIFEDTSYLSQDRFIYCMKQKDDSIIEHSTITDQNKTLRKEDRNKLSIPGGTDTESDTLNQNNTLRNEFCNSGSTIGATSTESNTLRQKNCIQLEQCSLTDFEKICENSVEGDEVHFGDGDVSQSEYTEPQQKQKSVNLYNKHNKEEEDAKVSDNDYVEDKTKEKFTPLRVQTEHDGFDKDLCLDNRSNEGTEETYRVIDQTESSQEDHEHSVLATEVTNDKSDVLNHEKHVQQQQELYSVHLDDSSETDDVDEIFIDHDQLMESQQIKDLVALGNVCDKEKSIYEEKAQTEFEEHFYLENRNNDDIECNIPVVDKNKLSKDEQEDLVSMPNELDEEDEDFSQKKWVLKQKDHTIDCANSSKNDNADETFVDIDQSIELQEKQKSIDLNNGYSKQKDKELNSTANDTRQNDELDGSLNNSNNEQNNENDSTVDENKTLQNEEGDSVSVVNTAGEKHDVLREERCVQPQQHCQLDFDKNEDVDEIFLNSGQCVESQQGQESTDLAYCDNEEIKELFIPIYDIRKQSKFLEYFTLEDINDEIIEDGVLIINNDNNIIIDEISVSSQTDQRIYPQEEYLSSDCNMDDIKELTSPIHDEFDKHFSSGNRNNSVPEEKSPVIGQNKISQEDQADSVPAAVGTWKQCDVLNHKTCVEQEENSLDFYSSSENDASDTFVNENQCTKPQQKQESFDLDNNSNQGVESLVLPANDDKKQAVSDEHFSLKNKHDEIMEESGLSIDENKASLEEKENSVRVVDLSNEHGGALSQQTCVQELQEHTMNSSLNDEKKETFPHSEQCMEIDLEQGTIALNNDCNKEEVNELILPEYGTQKQTEFQEQPCLEVKNDEGIKENSPEIAKNKTLPFEQQYSITEETIESSDVSSQENCNEEMHKRKMDTDSSSQNDDVNETFQDNDECTDFEQKLKSVDLEDNCEKQIVRDVIISLPDARKQAKFEEHFRSETRTIEYTERNVFTVEDTTSEDEQGDSTSVIDVTDEEDDALVENNQCRDSQQDEESIGISNPYNQEKTKELIKPLEYTGKQAECDEYFHLEKRSNAIVEKKSQVLEQNKTLQDNKDNSIPLVTLADGRWDVLSEERYIQHQEKHLMHLDNNSQQIQKSIDLYDDCNEKEINEQYIPAHIARKAAENEEHICLENKNKESILENGGIICQSKIYHDERDDSLSVTDSGDEESSNQQRLEASVHLMDTSDISDDDCEAFDDKKVEVLVENHCTKDYYNTPQDNDEGRISNISQPYSMPIIDTSNNEQAHEILVVLDNLSDVSEEGDPSDTLGESLKNSEAEEGNGMKENVDNDSSEGKMENEDSKTGGIPVDSNISGETDETAVPVFQYEDISEDDDDCSSKKSHSQDVKSVDPREVLRILTSKNLSPDKSSGSDWTNSNIAKHNEKENIVSDGEGKNVSDIAAEKLPETQTDLDSKNVLSKRTAERCKMVLRSQKKSPNKKRSRKRVGKSTKGKKSTPKSQTKQTNVESDNKHITMEAILHHSASQVLNPEECDEKGSTVIVLNTNLKSQKRKRSVENCDFDRRVKKNGKFGTLVKESYRKYENNADFLETVSYNNKLHIDEFPFG
ncbi:protein PFC0760c-like [Stegodyphus dumicola]|uniref:protein PFC0760c-like n=1 Tax=Stegodyphus dumicola TaxID=202533 RepID=UPI0015AEF214|nr:protein PFC0760c-like [Stegodyphus dumicola]